MSTFQYFYFFEMFTSWILEILYIYIWRYMEEDQVGFNWVVANYKFKWRYMEEDQVGFNWVVANSKFK